MHGSTMDYKKNWNEEVYYSQVVEEVEVTHWEVTLGRQGEEQKKRKAGPGGTYTFSGSCVECLRVLG